MQDLVECPKCGSEYPALASKWECPYCHEDELSLKERKFYNED
jgi:Zn finger protein HypA/HybF involved in hydrogenase expression